MPKHPTIPAELLRENERLRARLAEAEEALRAIRSGEVDALVLPGPDGAEEVFTLKTADHAYRVLVEEMQEGAVVVCGEGSSLYANRRFAEMLKRPLERVVGHPFVAAVTREDRAAVGRLLGEARSGRAKGEFTMAADDGTEVPVYLSASVFPMDGQPVLCVVATDLTEQKRTERIVAADHAKDEFLAMLSHELRTPLNPVMATVQLMEMDPSLPPDLRESVAMIRRNVELEVRLIDDLLDLTKISRGKVDLRREPLDAHAAIKGALDINQGEIAAKQLVVSLSLWAERFHVFADPARLQQVFWNLLKNAVKFTPRFGRIDIRSANEDGRLRVRVSDTGIGIDAAALPKLFNAFQQADRTITRRFGGLGLGLAISKALVEMHDGTLVAASEGDGKGATFTLELPTTAVASAPAARRGLSQRTASADGGGRCRILLVDDHADTLDVMTRVLRGCGHVVRTAGSVREALAAAASGEAFDLLISDIGLPDGSGLELMAELRRAHRVAGIALSGYGTDDDLRRSREAGFAEHLTKPVDVRRLEEVIGGLLK